MRRAILRSDVGVEVSRWALVAGIGVGCAASTATNEDDPCEPSAAPTLEIGVGLAGFEAVADGEGFPLIHGPQGGFHLEIGLRGTHLDTSELATGRLTGTIDGVVLAESSPYVDFRCMPDAGAQDAYGMLLVYDATPEFLDGQTTEITAEVTDAAGNEVSATCTFVIEDAE